MLLTLSFSIVQRVHPEICPPACGEFLEKWNNYSEELDYLLEIKNKNLEFIGKLRPDQKTQRLKANSNIRIADERVENLNMDNRELIDSPLVLSCHDQNCQSKEE